MDNRPIGIFDSGVGGLSVLLDVKKLLPHESFIYVADQAYIPYGTKSKTELMIRVTRIMDFFSSKNVKAVIIACNTATVHTIDEMRKMYEVPIIGSVPVVKTLATITKSGKTAVFSTPATAKSAYLEALIKKFAPQITVIKVGGTGLEELIEEGDVNLPAIKKILIDNLLPLKKAGVDAIALGCTHYPFLKEKIKDIAGDNIAVVDSGEAIARQVKVIMENNNALSNEKGEDRYYTTGNAQKFKQVSERLTKTKLKNVEHITL